MPVYAFQLSSHLAGRAVSVSPAGSDSVVASGTLDESAAFSVSLPVGDYVAVAGSGQYAYRAAGTVDQGDPDRLADSALGSTFAVGRTGPANPQPDMPPGQEFVWFKTDGSGTLLDIVTGVGS